jgi:hypothetical protein
MDIVEFEGLASRLHLTASDGLPDEIRNELVILHQRDGRDAFVRAAEFQRMLHALRNEVDFILLKGIALIGPLYPEAVSRAMVDVDVLVRSAEDADRAAGALARAGFATGRLLPGHHHKPMLRREATALGIELHTNFITPPLPEALLRELWDRRAGHTLDPVGQLVHHAIHAVNDPVDSPLLRNLFETAWLAGRVPAHEFQVFVRRWGIAHLLARPLRMAHELYASPLLVEPIAPGFLEHWCRRRLTWYGELNAAQRIERALARKHIERMQFGAGPRNIFPILGILSRGTFQRLECFVRDARGPWTRAEGHAVRVDSCTLFESRDTGELHMLNAEATQAWESLRGPRGVMRALRAKGLIVRRRPTAPFPYAAPPSAPGAPRP